MKILEYSRFLFAKIEWKDGYKQKPHRPQLFTREFLGNPIFAGCFFLVGFLVGRLVISKFHGFIEK